jgi:hypothetical protein
LKRFLEKLAVLVFVGVFARLVILAMLDGDPFTVWCRFGFAGLLLVVLALYGASLSRLKREQAEEKTKLPPAQ